MKNIIKLIFSFLIIASSLPKAFSQVDAAGVGGHVWVATYYCGWDFSSNHALDIKNEASQPINFYTNAGSGTFNSQRMIIDAGGNVGIGNFTAPSRLLDVFGSANSPQFRISYDASNYTDFKAPLFGASVRGCCTTSPLIYSKKNSWYSTFLSAFYNCK